MRKTVLSIGLPLLLGAAVAGAQKPHEGHEDHRAPAEASTKQETPGHGMHDMHAHMQALHDHSKMMDGISDQEKLMEEMRKHLRMMDEMMARMMEHHAASASGAGSGPE